MRMRNQLKISPLKYRQEGTLSMRFLQLKDEKDGPSVKIALFGNDAHHNISMGDVLHITDTYRWKDTATLSTKKTTKLEFLPSDSLPFHISQDDQLSDDDFADDPSSSNTPEDFTLMGVQTAHKYRCCPKPECRNKKLEEGKCPSGKATSTQVKYYAMASVVIKRKDSTYLTTKFFLPELEKIVTLGPLEELGPDPALRDLLTRNLPINAHGLIKNGFVTITSRKRSLE